jgi:hypothetical protein
MVHAPEIDKIQLQGREGKQNKKITPILLHQR